MAGSTGIILTVPLVAFLSAYFMSMPVKKRKTVERKKIREDLYWE